MGFKSFTLKNGTVIVPEEILVLHNSLTDDANYAGIVCDRFGGMPEILFFSDEPISMDMDEQTYLNILVSCINEYPFIEDFVNKSGSEDDNEVLICDIEEVGRVHDFKGIIRDF